MHSIKSWATLTKFLGKKEDITKLTVCFKASFKVKTKHTDELISRMCGVRGGSDATFLIEHIFLTSVYVVLHAMLLWCIVLQNNRFTVTFMLICHVWKMSTKMYFLTICQFLTHLLNKLFSMTLSLFLFFYSQPHLS